MLQYQVDNIHFLTSTAHLPATLAFRIHAQLSLAVNSITSVALYDQYLYKAFCLYMSTLRAINTGFLRLLKSRKRALALRISAQHEFAVTAFLD